MADRLEDIPLLLGRGRFVDNYEPPGTLRLRLVRSPHANARIRAINVKPALDVPGVVAVVTASDLAGAAQPLPVSHVIPGLRVTDHYPLAQDYVRFVGDPVVAVVAVSREAAADAAEVVTIDWDPLPPVIDPEAALDERSPHVHPELGTNVAFEMAVGELPLPATDEVGVAVRLENQRLVPAAMEPRGIVAEHRPGDSGFTLHLSTQAPHVVRTQLAKVLGVREHHVRVVAGDVGGAFGAKLNVYPEDVLAAVLARRLGRPVKWIEERSEAMVATSHGRGQLAELSANVRADGRISAIHVSILGDLGAYLHPNTPVGPVVTAMMVAGCYDIPHQSLRVRGVYTNKTPIDPYRGFARAEASYFIERLIDAIARRLGLDPVAVRRRNFITRFPHVTPLGIEHENGEFAVLLDRALALADYKRVREEQRRGRAEGRWLGVGVASYVWRAAYPSKVCGPGMDLLPGGWDAATVGVERTGGITVRVGVSPHGQGLATVLAELVAAQTGVDRSDVRVVAGDTEATPYGMGTAGSRSLATAGSAVQLATARVLQKAARLAAHHLEASADDIGWVGGQAQVRGVPSRRIHLYELAHLAYHGANRPPDMEPGLEASASFDPEEYNSPAGAHVCVVEVDPDTGKVVILRHIAVDDCGRVLNADIVTGQVHGALAQGIGQALHEAATYEATGQLETSSFLTYGVPAASELPPFVTDQVEIPSTRNPLGVKGIGEAGTIGAPPAVVNAVLDALAPLGIEHLDMPLTPERVWRATCAATEGALT